MSEEEYSNLKDKVAASGQGKTEEPDIKHSDISIRHQDAKTGGPPIITEKSGSIRPDRQFPAYAMVIRDRINSKYEHQGTFLEIQSSIIQEAIRRAFGEHSQLDVRADPIIFQKPYYPLFQRRNKIKNIAEAALKSNDETKKAHFKWLLKFMDDNFPDLEIIHKSQVEKGLIEFKNIQMIFASGGILVGKEKGLEECVILHDISDILEDKQKGGKYVKLRVFRLQYNGTMFGLSLKEIRLDEFSATRQITELDCYPADALSKEKREALFKALIERGKKWCETVEVIDGVHHRYSGIIQVPKANVNKPWKLDLVPVHVSGRIVLDHESFVATYPAFEVSLHSTGIRSQIYTNQQPKPEHNGELPCLPGLEITEDSWIPEGNIWSCEPKMNGATKFEPNSLQALICPAWSPGYSFSDKMWGYFGIERVKAIDWKEDPIQELQIRANEKQILVDVVTEHLGNGGFRDVVGEKGQGLIILLYGPPGCGKTLTAELIAEQKRRPLLRISCGDLGENTWHTDKKLHNLLKLALKCSAIVLIDEADVFLSKRTETGADSYNHNTLVAVFLKHLEYFPGVMFLTSNRQDEFDEAAESRIHIHLQYEALDLDRKATLWKSHLKGSNVPKDWDLNVCRELAGKYDINGREIKNLIQVSTAICRQRDKMLSMSDIEQVYALRRKSNSKSVCDGRHTQKEE